ncbi:MAG: DUF3558 family protein, partial [Vicinamibacteria bacterium]
MNDLISLRSWLILVAGLAFSAVVAPGCGGGQAPEESATTSEAASTEEASSSLDVCTLLTPAEIQEVMGQAPGDPQHLEEGLGGCAWSTADSSSTLVRIVLSGSSYDSYEDFVAGYQSEFGGEEPPTEYYRPIQGVGDWAMYLADQGALQVFQGGRMLEVATTPADEARSVELS